MQSDNRNARRNSSQKAPIEPQPSSGQAETFDMGKYKTKLCRHWKSGYCLFGPACVFAHGVDDLCEPNLLVTQMSNIVLVPVNNMIQSYGAPMPIYAPNESGLAQIPNQSDPAMQVQPLPFISYLPSSQLSTGSHKLEGGMPIQSLSEFGAPGPFSFYNPQYSMKPEIIQPNLPSANAHIRGQPVNSDHSKSQMQGDQDAKEIQTLQPQFAPKQVSADVDILEQSVLINNL